MVCVSFAFDSFESRDWTLSVPVICPQHAFFAPHQSYHKPLFFFCFLPLTPKCFTPYWLVRYLVFDCKIIYCRIKNYKLTQEEETVSSQVI